jgi:ABC-type amino acid transport substrate-binding protein
MKLKKCMMLMLAVAFSAGILAGCGSTPQQKEQPKDSPKTPLRVATNATFVPFEFKGEEDSDYKGYEVDMIRAVGKAMGREIQFNNIPFSGIIPIIQAGDMDLAASGMTVTKARADKVLFAAPFYESSLVILTNKDSGIKSVADLQGKQVAVQMGTTAADYAQKQGLTIKQFDHNAEALMELKIGGSVAVIADKPVADYYVTTEAKDKSIVIPIPDSNKEYLAFAMGKKNTELQKEVNAAIAKLKETGEFQQIYKKWFNTDPGELPKTAEEIIK